MKKILILSVFTLVYLSLYKITEFETGDIGSATILVIGVPVFAFLSIVLLLICIYYFWKTKYDFKSLYFISLILNFISIFLVIFLYPINW